MREQAPIEVKDFLVMFHAQLIAVGIPVSVRMKRYSM
jgi:hypothetical protein